MSARNVRSALLARLPRNGDDRGSIPLLMLVMISTVALGTILLSMIISQSRATSFDRTRVHELAAAQAGIDMAVGKIRAATTTDPTTDITSGDDSKLPCDGPYNNQVADSNGIATYSVAITYYFQQPLITSNKMTCTSSGPYYVSTARRTPHFAVITSTAHDGTGAGASSGRTLQATYVFKTNDVNVTGGTIMIYPSGPSHYCMDAGSGTPTVGTSILLQSCSTALPPTPQQVWAYRPDLSIELASTSNLSAPLCIDTGTSPISHNSGDPMVLEPCKVSDVSTWCGAGVTSSQYAMAHSGAACVTSPMCPAGDTPASFSSDKVNYHAGETCSVSPWNQQWSVNDSAHLEGADTRQSNTDGYCIDAPSQADDVALSLASCGGSVSDTSQTWVPSPTAGAGMAGAGNNQLVDYQQFATCLDVTGQNVTASYLILYTCKQNPAPANVKWNQKFVPSPALDIAPTKTLLTVTTDSTASPPDTKYCLHSPDADGGYPTLVTPCPANVSSAGPGFVWTVSQHYADPAGTTELPYSTRYTITDDNGLCLTPAGNTDLYISEYYKAVVNTCNGGTEQKWNADPSSLGGALTDTHEVTS